MSVLQSQSFDTSFNPFSIIDQFMIDLESTKDSYNSTVIINSLKLIEAILKYELRELEEQSKLITIDEIKLIDFDKIYDMYIQREELFSEYLEKSEIFKDQYHFNLYRKHFENIIDYTIQTSWVYQSFENRLSLDKHAS